MVNELPSAVPHLRLGSAGPVLVSVFGNWPNGPMLRAIRRAQLELSKEHRRVLSLTIIPDVQQLPTIGHQQPAEREGALAQSAAIATEVERVTAGSAMVIHPRGVIGVMVRTFMATLSVMSRSTMPLKTFRTVEEAEAWFATLPDAPKLSPGLSRAVTSWLAAQPSARAG
ncbi:MAG: hypothetical protein JNJ54_08540 [Myxococcaceae bacterium]|nr:hypothetical protein [Myxococcaceae bacterium]